MGGTKGRDTKGPGRDKNLEEGQVQRGSLAAIPFVTLYFARCVPTLGSDFYHFCTRDF
jgi:hypothetical protein